MPPPLGLGKRIVRIARATQLSRPRCMLEELRRLCTEPLAAILNWTIRVPERLGDFFSAFS